ncbi:ABC transporter substrate-binding protein [Tepiditoga spiralis]|uniref:ABC transporter substrate-binding protein n=1 Tax=Tepiditoga spiralis TaxID=2108365 RepID=A0A7G1G4F8_9BACT|nr:ABC transporter substrate-binding protein [Tepiditoga spiralis]BBE31251.1 ABC transporter substrate-binding protein [Tepiditoga spiralis]
MKKWLVVLVVVFSVFMFSKTTVEFWHAMSGDRIALIQSMAEDFMKLHPDIVIKAQYTGSYRDTLNKLTTSIKSGKSPNLVQVYDIGTRAMIDGDVALPMQDMIDKDPNFDSALFLDQVLNYYRVNGKLYSMPFNSSNAVLFYNKTLFKKAGLDPNKPPKTYEELIDYSRKLAKIGVAGLTWPTHSWFFEQLLAAQDALFTDNNNGRTGKAENAVFNSEAGRKIFQLLDTMTKENLIINTKREDWSGARQIFLSGKAAMVLFSTSDAKAFYEMGKENGYDVGAAFLPVPKGSAKGGVIIGGGSLWMIKGHSNAENNATWEFVKFMAEPAQQIKWHLGTGYFPVRKDAIEQLLDSNFYSKNPVYLGTIMQLLMSKQDYSTMGAVIGVFPQARDQIETAFEKVINNQEDYKKALEEAEKSVTESIKEYNDLYN